MNIKDDVGGCYGASKTKITVSGSDVDIQYYTDTQPWTMGGQQVKVVENNEHLGQIVSGTRQEGKNVDARISKARNAIFSLLGPGFSYKCQLSPILKLHLYRTFVCPVLRSGISTFVLTKTLMEPLNVFQRKVLKGILKVSNQASTSALYFLTGELPIEAKIHKDIYSLFFSVWLNPNTKIYSIIKYILKNTNNMSRTWSNYVRYLCKQYGFEDPSSWLQSDPPKKSIFKTDIDIRIRAYHENELRLKATNSEKLKYFNVSLLGLSGQPHPALSNLINTVEVKKSRSHLKMLIGDFYTYEVKSKQSGGLSHCRVCCGNEEISDNFTRPPESICHILAICHAYSDIRNRIIKQYKQLCSDITSVLNFNLILSDSELLCQFILDPTSINLPEWINPNDPLS